MTLIFTNSGHLIAQHPFRLQEATKEVKNQITVGVLPQVELISIVQTISNYPTVLGFLMAQDSSKYKTDVINHFKPYQKHPVVLMLNRLCIIPGGLNFSAPSNIMLYTDNSLRLREDIEKQLQLL